MEKTVTISIKPEDSKAIFDRESSQWSSQLGYNRMYLTAIQNTFNDILKARGHVFLNEVLDDLGNKRTQNGQLIGWMSKEGAEIRFDVVEIELNRFELTFNIDGIIFDLI